MYNVVGVVVVVYVVVDNDGIINSGVNDGDGIVSHEMRSVHDVYAQLGLFSSRSNHLPVLQMSQV